MKVPALPTPSTAVDQEGILVGGRVDLIHLLDEVYKDMALVGTPWSGQVR